MPEVSFSDALDALVAAYYEQEGHDRILYALNEKVSSLSDALDDVGEETDDEEI